jgi:hypothetical protein
MPNERPNGHGAPLLPESTTKETPYSPEASLPPPPGFLVPQSPTLAQRRFLKEMVNEGDVEGINEENLGMLPKDERADGRFWARTTRISRKRSEINEAEDLRARAMLRGQVKRLIQERDQLLIEESDGDLDESLVAAERDRSAPPFLKGRQQPQ